MNPSARWVRCWLFERVDDQPAQQLREEVRALGGHPFAGVGDRADVLDRRRHHQGGEFEPAAAALLAGEVAAGGVAFAEADGDFVERRGRTSARARAAAVRPRGQRSSTNSRCRMLTPSPCHSSQWSAEISAIRAAPGVGEAGQRPLVVLRRVEAERLLVAFRFDLLPQRDRPIGPAAGRFGVEGVAQLRLQLRQRSSPAGRGRGGGSAGRAFLRRSSRRTSSARSWRGAPARVPRRVPSTRRRGRRGG